MLTTIDDYMDRAKEKRGLTSDRQLSAELGVSGPTTNFWRSRRTWPKDEVMTRLARLAEEDEEIALLQLNSWRTTGHAATLYLDLVKRLSAAAIIGLFFLGNIPRPALASNSASGELSGSTGAMYIMENTI